MFYNDTECTYFSNSKDCELGEYFTTKEINNLVKKLKRFKKYEMYPTKFCNVFVTSRDSIEFDHVFVIRKFDENQPIEYNFTIMIKDKQICRVYTDIMEVGLPVQDPVSQVEYTNRAIDLVSRASAIHSIS